MIQLKGNVATVGVNTGGLLAGAPHALHIHAGAKGSCPTAAAAHKHGRAPDHQHPRRRPVLRPARRRPDHQGRHEPQEHPRLRPVRPRGHPLHPHGHAARAGGRLHPGEQRGHRGPRHRLQPQRALRRSADRSDLDRKFPGEATEPALCGPIVAKSGGQANAGGGEHTYVACRPTRRRRRSTIPGCATPPPRRRSSSLRIRRARARRSPDPRPSPMAAGTRKGKAWRLLAVLAAVAVAVAVIVVAVADHGSGSKAPAPSLRVAKTHLGSILVDGTGRTLYVYTRDKGLASACHGVCAKVWPPALRARGPGRGSGRGDDQARRDHARRSVAARLRLDTPSTERWARLGGARRAARASSACGTSCRPRAAR